VGFLPGLPRRKTFLGDGPLRTASGARGGHSSPALRVKPLTWPGHGNFDEAIVSGYLMDQPPLGSAREFALTLSLGRSPDAEPKVSRPDPRNIVLAWKEYEKSWVEGGAWFLAGRCIWAQAERPLAPKWD